MSVVRTTRPDGDIDISRFSKFLRLENKGKIKDFEQFLLNFRVFETHKYSIFTPIYKRNGVSEVYAHQFQKL